MNHIAVRRGIAAVLLLAFLRIAAASHSGIGASQRTARINVGLIDLAGLPEKMRIQSETTVIAIFHRAGLELTFMECRSTAAAPCFPPAGKGDFRLQIMKQRPNNLHRDAAGFAVLMHSERPGDSYAAVSFPLVESAALDLEAPVADVLAAALAHEIGHVLLNTSGHSRSGIMSPRLDRRQIRLLERGELLFTEDEAARLLERAAQFNP